MTKSAIRYHYLSAMHLPTSAYTTPKENDKVARFN